MKYDEPTPDDLGLPSETVKLWRLESLCQAPRAAWQAYYSARQGFYEESDAREKAREKLRDLRRGERRRKV